MTSTPSYAGYFPYGKCKHVDCIQGDLERAQELGEWALSFGAVLEGDGLGGGGILVFRTLFAIFHGRPIECSFHCHRWKMLKVCLIS